MNMPDEWVSGAGVRELIGWLVHLVEAGGALIIFVGAVWAFARFATTGMRRRSLIGEFNKIRLSLGRIERHQKEPFRPAEVTAGGMEDDATGHEPAGVTSVTR
ncbi:hypothetical protein [Streptomyces sp. fd1-xmd]|uniref:hypothetical protein n=1 Tax=Streptomyces sp. fd1-xmd TaxID=1812480 RepID=UPI0009904C67|nr:hypothetical protein [Streptomyces sp. fd1-xmd]AQT75564.1 hypothetical protein B1K54_31565 [Streptomyces sp. fd1-xmd]